MAMDQQHWFESVKHLPITPITYFEWQPRPDELEEACRAFDRVRDFLPWRNTVIVDQLSCLESEVQDVREFGFWHRLYLSGYKEAMLEMLKGKSLSLTMEVRGKVTHYSRRILEIDDQNANL